MIKASAPLHDQLKQLEIDPQHNRRLRVMLEHAKRNIHVIDEDMLRRAFSLAYWAHRDDRRASGEAYIVHPLEVATIVAKNIPFDDMTVAAALLHDTVEDTELSLELIQAEFGPDMRRIIDGLTKIDKVFESRELWKAENVRKLMLSMANDIRVILVKFADRLHNMRTLGSLPAAKQLKISTETRELFVPLAHRFGLNEVKIELEDLSLKYIEPLAYREIADGLNAKRKQRETYIQRFIDPIKLELEARDLKFEITGRPKSIASIHRKMIRQEKTLDEIYDLFAIRIILKSTGREGREDCWRVYSILTDLYQPIPERYRDFISTPKSNGYQSLHTTVVGSGGRLVEIQIRTEEMHAVAERGVAAHWRYKEDQSQTSPDQPAKTKPSRAARGEEALERIYAWVRDLLENPTSEGAGEFVKDFEHQLYEDELYVFTPQGDLVTLPTDATPVDFAFQVHTEVGFHCIGAKVNGKMVPLSYRLSSGDQVEILTSPKQTPNPDWMNFVVTQKARSRIRHWIREKRRKAAALGREAVERKLKRAKLDLSEHDLNVLSSRLKFSSLQQLFYEIGTGLYDVNDFVQAARERDTHPTQEPAEDAKQAPLRLTVDEFTETARQEGRASLFIDGEQHTDMVIRYASCCSPIPGDEVFGFVSKTGSINIHRRSCKNATHLLYDHEDRIVPVEWSRQKDVQFVAALRIVGEDRVGLVSDLTTTISKNLKTNIRSITIDSEDGVFEGTIVLLVSDLSHLRRLIQRINRLDGVFGVYRLED